jgi:hypothetical protein
MFTRRAAPHRRENGVEDLKMAVSLEEMLDGADLAGAFLNGAQFLNCAQLVVTRNWQSAFRDKRLPVALQSRKKAVVGLFELVAHFVERSAGTTARHSVE